MMGQTLCITDIAYNYYSHRKKFFPVGTLSEFIFIFPVVYANKVDINK